MTQLPPGWAETNLGEICSKPQYGFTTKSSTHGRVKYLRTTDLTSGKINWSNVPFCIDEPEDDEKYQLNDNDIVISRAGSVGFHSLIKNPLKPVIFASYLIRFRPFVHPEYLSFFLDSKDYWDQLKDKSVGVAVQNVNAKKLAELVIPVAPLPEQIRIANKLDSLLAKVETAQTRLEKIPALLKRFRQAVLAAATSGELTREWREENIGLCQSLSSLGVITEYDGKELIPLCETWCYLPFEKSATIKSNLVDPLLTPDAIHLAPNHIESNTGRVIGKATVSDDGVMSNKHKFFSGQIVYSKIRPYLNKVCLVDFDGVCSADMYPVEAHINTHYLLIYMLSDQFVTWTAQKQGRVVLPKINQKALNKIPVPVPSENEQAEIVRRVESLFTMADTVGKQYQAAKARLDKLTQAILAKAFRGELVPQDPNDEPAAELLKRIQAGK